MPISLFIQMKLLTIESDQAIVCVCARMNAPMCVYGLGLGWMGGDPWSEIG